MGAYSPVPITHDLQEKILKNIMAPVIKGMSDAGTPYQGFLYAGLMLDKTGEVRVLEFNCRLGDPETQPLLMRLKTDLFDVIEATLSRRLDQITLDWDARSALTVVIAAAGYPGDYRKGDVIPGLTGHYPNDTFVFQAGTRRVGQEIQTDGGRVLGVTALGTDLKDAQKKAYNLCQELTWPGAGYRMDIGWRGISQ
jgi:phosphoribosylamine--glycine ligase